jgi:hypothetical protein
MTGNPKDDMYEQERETPDSDEKLPPAVRILLLLAAGFLAWIPVYFVMVATKRFLGGS